VLKSLANAWRKFADKHKGVAQFIVFFMLSNGVTVLQMVLMPIFKAVFEKTALIDISFQIFHIGQNLNGSNYYMFDYASGSISDGGGGGLAYFLAVEITLAIAQIINFFAQRKITFKANNNVWWSAMWYVIAYIGITLIAAAAQGLYKTPIYTLLMDTWGMGGTGETIADVITMIINSAISFWVFFPIFRVIFKNKPAEESTDEIAG
jgi:putative flippase GtrA